MTATIVGPACELGDTFARGREITAAESVRPRLVPSLQRAWRQPGRQWIGLYGQRRA